MKPVFFTFFIFVILFNFLNFSFADQTDSERVVAPNVVEAQKLPENKWYAGTFCDFGDVVLGSRNGAWTEVTAWLGYKQNNTNIYGAFTIYEV